MRDAAPPPASRPRRRPSAARIPACFRTLPIVRRWGGRALLAAALAASAVAGSALPAAAASRLTGDLPRRADLGFTTGGNEGELEVRRVEEGSAAAAAGLRAGDTVVAVMGQAFAKPYVGQDRLRRLDGGAPVVLEVERDGRRHEVAFTPPPLPLETFAGLEAEYGDVTTPDGAWLRTILTRPGGASGPLPAIFLAQWVSCDTVEVNAGGGAWSDVIRGVAERSGMVLLRVERASGGDSEGPGCHELDYDTEVAHYRHVLDQLSRHPWVDAGRLVLWGSSLGGTVAPLLA
ncbi:MAG TPA: PDZ domain-containing protein, partial [Thermoanaerobaculia bacterium]|nr:PDZ domain-containing protein [Thermoanaerobaculia bacterium]